MTALTLHLAICCDCCHVDDLLYADDITLARELASEQGWSQRGHLTLCAECSGTRPATYCDDCREGRGIITRLTPQPRQGLDL